jgi:hypothetical protein
MAKAGLLEVKHIQNVSQICKAAGISSNIFCCCPILMRAQSNMRRILR